MKAEKLNVLVVDDELSILITLKELLGDKYNVTTLSDGKDAIDSLVKGDKYDILIIDFRLQAYSGLDILMEAKKHLGCYKAILLTAFSDKEILEKAINNNLVSKVVNKPFDPEQFSAIVDEATDTLHKELNNVKYIETLKTEINAILLSASIKSSEQIVMHKSTIMKEAIATAQKYAASAANLILTGENGVGKEVFANIIHINGKRSGKPFIKVNCSAIPENLFEAELFGYEKGAYTGAINTKPGKFKLADGGSIFLDEIGELPIYLQPKLLRVIETKEFSPLGSNEILKTDVRVICATNVDLKEKVEKGDFREDLYYRLSTLNIHIPSLRERPEDIPILATYFMKTISIEEGGPEREFTPEALEYLSNLEFKGNVRELKNIVYRLYLSGDNSEITQTDVVSATKQYTGNMLNKEMDLRSWLETMERKKIEMTLGKYENNVGKTAQALGIQRTNLYKKLKDLGIKNE